MINGFSLDGTDPNCIFGLPSAFMGKQAMVAIFKDEYKDHQGLP